MLTATLKRTIIDRQMPAYDAVRTEHRVVPGDVETVYEIVREADFIRAWRESPAVRVLFAVRATGERVVSAVTGRSPAPPARRAASGTTAATSMPGYGRAMLKRRLELPPKHVFPADEWRVVEPEGRLQEVGNATYPACNTAQRCEEDAYDGFGATDVWLLEGAEIDDAVIGLRQGTHTYVVFVRVGADPPTGVASRSPTSA